MPASRWLLESVRQCRHENGGTNADTKTKRGRRARNCRYIEGRLCWLERRRWFRRQSCRRPPALASDSESEEEGERQSMARRKPTGTSAIPAAPQDSLCRPCPAHRSSPGSSLSCGESFGRSGGSSRFRKLEGKVANRFVRGHVLNSDQTVGR